MNRIILIVTTFWLSSCQSNTKLFDDIKNIVEFEREYMTTKIQSGKESGFIEPIMEFSIYKMDTLSFSNLEKEIQKNRSFKQGKYYLNIELDDYLKQRKLQILNMSKSLISDNHYDKTYHIYLFSDRKTFSICKVNH